MRGRPTRLVQQSTEPDICKSLTYTRAYQGDGPEAGLEDGANAVARFMSDLLLLSNGSVIIINGATNGTAGWENAVSPDPSPILYKTYELNPFKRFSILSPSRIPRVYHSAAVLLPDGRVLVGGSNPHMRYDFTSYPHPTESSLEAYSPYYLEPRYAPIRPTILSIEIEGMIVLYNQTFAVTLVSSIYCPDLGLSVSILTPSFTTHSLALNQRPVISM